MYELLALIIEMSDVSIADKDRHCFLLAFIAVKIQYGDTRKVIHERGTQQLEGDMV